MLVNNSDNYKHNCEFAEETVLYLYGEMGETQMADFRSHLKNCSTCADEISAFSSIHSSIQNWKSAEFDLIAAPIIEMPDGGRQKSDAPVSSSWLANLRERFSISFGWVQAGALAALLIGPAFGLFFIASSGKQEQISEKKENTANNQAAPNIEEKTSEIAKSESKTEDEFPEKASTPDNSLADVEPEEKILPNKKSASTKISTNRKNPVVRESSSKQPSNRKIKAPEIYANVAPVTNRNLPKLNNLPEEVEEEDLRLADLFDEIDEG
jgi:hypothetical protein